MQRSRTLLMLRLAGKNILLNWRHSVATVLAITAGFAAVALLDGFISAINEISRDGTVNKGMIGQFLVEKRGTKEHLFEDPWKYSITRAEQETFSAWLTADSRVKAYMPYLSLSGLIANGKNSAIFIAAAIDEERGLKFRGEKWAWNTPAGVPFFRDASGFQIGSGLATRMDCKFNEPYKLKKDGSYLDQEQPLECENPVFQLSATTEHGQVNALSLTATGLVDLHVREYNDKVIYLPLKVAQELLDTERITRFSVLLHKETDVPAFRRDYNQRLQEAGLDLELTHWLDHPVGAASKGGMEVLNMFRLLFLTVVAVVAVMSVANSLMKSINERIREIGTLRSYGFRRQDIVLLFSFEGLTLGLAACLVGMLVSSGIAFAITQSGMTFKAGIMSTPIPIKIDLALAVWATSAAVLCLVTFLASWIVSRRAANMTIADALRHIA